MRSFKIIKVYNNGFHLAVSVLPARSQRPPLNTGHLVNTVCFTFDLNCLLDKIYCYITLFKFLFI